MFRMKPAVVLSTFTTHLPFEDKIFQIIHPIFFVNVKLHVKRQNYSTGTIR
jgi:hypothetical protein